MYRGLIIAAVLLLGNVAASRNLEGQSPLQPDLDRAIRSAFFAAFSLDQEVATAEARRAVALGPSVSRAHRTLAAVLWLDMLFLRGALSVDHYLDALTKSNSTLPKPPPQIEAEFKAEVAKAIELADAALTRNPRDLGARYDLGAAYGIQASYVASVQGSMASAFRLAKRAYDAQEEVLARDPKWVSAGTVVGTYRYAVSALSLPTRLLAYMVGFGGGKERGIALLQAAAADAADTRAEAKAALVLIFSREGRHAEALRILAELEAEFPKNRLFVLERGAAAIRAGRFAEAEATLKRGMAAFELDGRRKLPSERALWHYKLALSRIGLKRPAEATMDLDAALKETPADWIRGRIHLALGQAADLAGMRSKALGEYRTASQIGKVANDPWCTVRAAQLLRQPFTLGPS